MGGDVYARSWWWGRLCIRGLATKTRAGPPRSRYCDEKNKSLTEFCDGLVAGPLPLS